MQGVTLKPERIGAYPLHSKHTRYSVESCVICDSWNETPHAKRFTTPIAPHCAEETMVIGYWLGTRQDATTSLCEKHRKSILAIDAEKKRRSSPTTPPPPRMPTDPPNVLPQVSPQNPKAYVIPRNTGILPSTPPTETLRQSFLAIAQDCAAKYAKQHPLHQDSEKQMVTEVPHGVLRQALMTIVEHTNDPEAAQFAAQVLDGNAVPPVPSEPPSSETLSCPLCHKNVKPGEVHSC